MQPGQLDMEYITLLHNWLLSESSIYRYAFENNMPGLMNHWQQVHMKEFNLLSSRTRVSTEFNPFMV